MEVLPVGFQPVKDATAGVPKAFPRSIQAAVDLKHNVDSGTAWRGVTTAPRL